jgi:hypothetical protein
MLIGKQAGRVKSKSQDAVIQMLECIRRSGDSRAHQAMAGRVISFIFADTAVSMSARPSDDPQLDEAQPRDSNSARIASGVTGAFRLSRLIILATCHSFRRRGLDPFPAMGVPDKEIARRNVCRDPRAGVIPSSVRLARKARLEMFGVVQTRPPLYIQVRSGAPHLWGGA